MTDAEQTTPATSTWTERLARIIGNNKWLKGLVHDVLVEEDLNDPVVETMRRSKCFGDANVRKCTFNDGVVCRACGCVLEIKIPAKTNLNIHKGRIEVTHCPTGQWDDENLMVYYQNN